MKEVFEYIISLLKSRIFPMILVFIVLISVLVHRLFVLQIINGDSYVEDLSSSIQKDMSVAAARGRIYDRNGVLLAYNDCLLYTSDAADEEDSVDLGCPRIIKKKKKYQFMTMLQFAITLITNTTVEEW